MTEIIIKLKNLNWLFIFLVSFLSFVGLVMIYSATFGEESKIFISHIYKVTFGFILMILVSLIDVEFWKKKAYLFYFAAIWLFVYGCIRIKGAVIKSSSLSFKQEQESNFWSTMGTVFIITFANPHVYLDTVFLIGTISLQYDGYKEILFGLGASIASFFFFFSLGYGCQILFPI